MTSYKLDNSAINHKKWSKLPWQLGPLSGSHLVPLLCVSSFICLWGDGHRSSSDGLNILFTSTLLKNTQEQTCAIRIAFAFVVTCTSSVCVASICILSICMMEMKMSAHTHPSLSISSVLKVNTWKWSMSFKLYALIKTLVRYFT